MARNTARFLITLIVAAVLSGCGSDELPDNKRLLEAFETMQTGVWVSGHGTVTQILPNDFVDGNTRQRFMVRIDDNLRVQLLHQVIDSPPVPVERGEVIGFQGRYVWDSAGGVISLTHHDPDRPGSGGWVSYQGTRYQ